MIVIAESTHEVRPMNLNDRITIDPAICHGKPTIRGLRYPVEIMMELFSSGMSIEEILDDYEDLEREDLLAVLAGATHCYHEGF
jgi:uncharacterized protein (DUF433 family)